MTTIMLTLVVLSLVSYVIALVAGLGFRKYEACGLCALISLALSIASLALVMFQMVVS